MPNPTLQIRIITPQKLLFQGLATSVSSKNSAGNFDILPWHANFLTLVENSPIILRLPDKKKLTFNLSLAIIQNYQNKVNIYTYVQPQTK